MVGGVKWNMTSYTTLLFIFRNKPFPVKARVEYFHNILTVYIHNGMSNNDKDFEMCIRWETFIFDRFSLVWFRNWLITAAWIKTCSKPYWKFMYLITLYPVFCKYKNVQSWILKLVLLALAFGISGLSKLVVIF